MTTEALWKSKRIQIAAASLFVLTSLVIGHICGILGCKAMCFLFGDYFRAYHQVSLERFEAAFCFLGLSSAFIGSIWCLMWIKYGKQLEGRE